MLPSQWGGGIRRGAQATKGGTMNIWRRFGRISCAILLGVILSNSASAAPFAYITNQDDDNVSVIDVATDTVIATIPVGIGPYGVAVTPDGTQVYVENSGNHFDAWGTGTSSVSVINTASNTVTATVTVGNSTYGGSVAVTPDSTKAYVANSSDGTVSVILTATNTIAATVQVDDWPYAVAVTPDGSRVYVARLWGNIVSVIDTATDTVTATVQMGERADGVAVLPVGTDVYVANEDTDTVSVIDTATNNVTTSIAVGHFPVCLAASPDSAKVYVANALGASISVIDTATKTVTATVPIPSTTQYGPFGIDVTPDGTRVYVAVLSNDAVSVIDTATNTVIDAVPVGTFPRAFGRFIGGPLGVCGNGISEPGEQCDEGSANGMSSSCCTTACTLQPNNTACDDGNACTRTDTCRAGACIGANPVVCTALDQCHAAATCDHATGVCSDPAKPDGSTCNDGNACTQTDTCQAGVCVGTNFCWSGVLQPTNADGSSVFKLGQTIPTKFQLTGACASITDLKATAYVAKVSDSVVGTYMEAASTSAADSGNTFRYDPTANQYVFNLATKPLSAGTWQLRIDLGDGVMNRTTLFSLK